MGYLTVMDALGIEKPAWWAGATARARPWFWPRKTERAAGVFFFACNMDRSGAKEFTEFHPVLGRCFGRHRQDYLRLSATPDQFEEFAEAVGLMQRTQPNYRRKIWQRSMCRSRSYRASKMNSSNANTPNISPAAFPTRNCFSEGDHFAPLQRPGLFNGAMLAFLGEFFLRSNY